jgi:acyl carrier protein
MTEKTAVSREDVLATITEQLASFEVDASTVSAESAFDTLGLDSLDLVELSVRIEDAYGIDIEEDDLKDVTTVDKAIDLVLKKLEQA